MKKIMERVKEQEKLNEGKINDKYKESKIQEKLRNMEIFFDQEEYLVIDNGTGFIKAGFSG